ncbi:MAG: uL15 family ribosomal protein [Candidatus Micrarchaeota archaeon]
MVRRHARKSSKYHGTRSWGAGNIKHRRGKGSRGGKGRSGGQKHKWTYTTAYEPDRYGRDGFASVRPAPRLEVINLSCIEELAKSGKLKEEAGKLAFEFKGKVLGSGKLTSAVKVTALSFSENAKQKIAEAGGETQILAKAAKKPKKKG